MIMRRCGLILLPALGLAACTVRGAQEGASQTPPPAASTLAPYRYAPPPELDDGWRVAHAEELRIDVVQLEAMTEAIRRQEYANVHAVLIEKDGRLVYEEYFEGVDRRWRGDQWETVRTVFQRDSLHDTRSVGKSITSALIGVALGAGAIASLDTPLVAFFPEHARRLVTPEKRRITLRHALTMSAGLDWNEGAVPYTSPTNDSEQMYASNDPAGFVFGRALAAEPGSVHNYNSGLPVLLGFVVSRVTGRSFGAYAREVLFDPLGIRQVEWGGPTAWADIPEMRWNGSEPWARVASPAGGLWIRPRDLAKFGHLYLNAGRWNGRQLIPAPWVVESTRRHIAAKDSVSEFGEHGYGYFWWHDRFHTPYGELEVHTAHGNGGQRIFVIPSLDMAVTVLAGRYDDPEANWLPEQLLLRHIVPAARGSERSEPAALVFAHATVVDVSDGSLLPDRTVVVEGNRIRAVGSSEAVAILQDAQVIDARGRYLIPGLWDMHTHLLWSTDVAEHSAVKMPRDLSWTLWERYYAPALDLMIANGVTGIREMWGNLDIARRVQAEAATGVRLAPRMIVAGNTVDGSPSTWPGAAVATTPEHGRALVDSLAAAGADFIKPYSHLAPEVYFAIVERARERGIPVAGHVPFRVPASAAAAAGQRSFEHLIGVVPGCSSEEARLIDLSREQIEAAERGDRDRVADLDRQWKVRVLATQDHGNCRRLLETLARNRTWQVPTLVLNRGIAYQNDPDFAADPRLKYIPPAWRDSWLPENDPYLLSTEEGYQLRRQHHERKLEITGLAAQAGVPILAGSDTPSAFVLPGFAVHDELALLVEAGLTPLQALQAATVNPARYLDATDSLGIVEAGKLADLVLLDANPLDDIRNTQRIAGVVLNGTYLDRQAVDALLGSAAGHTANPASRMEVQEAEVPRTRTLPGIASPAFSYAHPEEVGLSSEKLDRLSDEIVSWVAAGDLVGAELLIVKDGRAVFHEAYGWSNRETRRPVERNSIWSIQSMSKPFTATAVLMLAEEGKLSLGDPVTRYIPAFAGDPRTTIRHLLTHTTGYRDPGVGDPSFVHASYAEWVEDWASQVPDGTFGEFSYTDFGFAAAGYIVEAVSGLPIDRFTEQRIIAPLRLADTSTGLSEDPAWRARVNPWYRWNAEAGVHHFRWSEQRPAYAFYPACCGMFSTAMDYAAFMAMWLNRGGWQGVRLLSPKTVEEALAEYGRDAWGGYGYGWEVESERVRGGGVSAFGHLGGDGTIAVAFPAEKVVVVLLAHSRYGPQQNALLEALAMLEIFDHPGYGPVRPLHDAYAETVELSPDERQRYVGTYADREVAPRWVAHVHDDGEILHLRVTRPGGYANWFWAHLVPLGEDRFGYGRYEGTRLQALHSHRRVQFELEGGRAAAIRIASGTETLLHARRTNADRILADAERRRSQIPMSHLLAAWLNDEGVEQARERFHALHAAGPDSVRFNDAELGALGRRLLREEMRVPEAIAVFELTTVAVPESSGAWDGLGDAYRTAGRLDDARRSYARAVELAEGQRHVDLPVFRRKLEWVVRQLGRSP